MVVQRDVLRRVHEASLIAAAAQRAGIAGIGRESPVLAGNWRAST
jgi:hypothetical protein